jgi:hypothetical protein
MHATGSPRIAGGVNGCFASFGVGEVFKSTYVFIMDTRVMTFAQILSSSLRLQSSQAAAAEDE